MFTASADGGFLTSYPHEGGSERPLCQIFPTLQTQYNCYSDFTKEIKSHYATKQTATSKHAGSFSKEDALHCRARGPPAGSPGRVSRIGLRARRAHAVTGQCPAPRDHSACAGGVFVSGPFKTNSNIKTCWIIFEGGCASLPRTWPTCWVTRTRQPYRTTSAASTRRHWPMPCASGSFCVCRWSFCFRPFQNKQQHQNMLDHFRRRMRFTAAHVAHLLGHQDASAVSDYERGEHTPSLANALRLGIILRVPVEFLFPALSKQTATSKHAGSFSKEDALHCRARGPPAGSPGRVSRIGLRARRAHAVTGQCPAPRDHSACAGGVFVSGPFKTNSNIKTCWIIFEGGCASLPRTW